MANILIVEDEKNMQEIIAEYMRRGGHTCFMADDGVDALMILKSNPMDLMILDIMMPHLDGFSVCKMAREMSNLPIIMLTAKSEDMDKLLGFEHGADDYLTKPFNILELKARIRALLRRAGTAKKQTPEQTLVCEHITLDRDSRSAFREDVPVDLTAKEFDLLELLVTNPNKVYSRETLLEYVWGNKAMVNGDVRTVDVHVRRLREKIEPSPSDPKYVHTKWGVGYFFRA